MIENKDEIIPIEQIEKKIFLLRGQKVMLDTDLADLYGVPTKRLNEQVRRNSKRFPDDFMFQLTEAEKREVVAICDHLKKVKYSKVLPLAFTEHGALMLASVLSSERAVQISLYVVRAFVKLREILATHKELAGKLAELERKIEIHDETIFSLFDAIHQLMDPPPLKHKTRIGF